MGHLLSYPLKFHPIPKKSIWGGQRLKTFFQLETQDPIGEVWTLSGHKNSVSVCMNGPLAGKELTEITREYPALYLGNSEKDCFPILVSFLYAEQNLSVQVHPDDAYALRHDDDYGKAESWYILEARPGAKLNYGHAFPTRHAYKQAVANGCVEKYLKYIDVSEDDFIFVPPGTLHTITPGILLIEIQQTSDVTYRVYDWNRVDTTGRSRELHVDKAADVLVYDTQAVPDTRKIVQQMPNIKQEQLIDDDCFSIDKWDFSNELTLSLGKKGQPDILICARGKGVLNYREDGNLRVGQGDTIVVPTDLSGYEIYPSGNMTLLRVCYEQ